MQALLVYKTRPRSHEILLRSGDNRETKRGHVCYCLATVLVGIHMGLKKNLCQKSLLTQ